MRRTVLVEPLEHRTLLAAVPVISGNGHTIANGDATPSQADATDFSWAEVGGSMTRQYRIQNTGDSPLVISSSVVTGLDRSAFRVVDAPTGAIAPGQSANLTVQFAPRAKRAYNATLDVQTNSLSAPDYSFAIAGSGLTTVLLPGGLRYGIVSAGTGSPAQKDWQLTINYTGWLRSNGTVFDSSLDAGRTPYELFLGAGSVIQGWDQGLVGIRPGERRVLFIPSALGYGASGSGTKIPPNADLIFDTSLVSSTSPQSQFPLITFSGSGHAIANRDTTWSATDATAFYSTGQPVTQDIVIDLNSLLVRRVANLPVFTGPGAAQFAVTDVNNISGEKYAVSITYTPVAGQPSNAKLFYNLDAPDSPTYRFSLHGETLASGVSFTNGALSVSGTGNNDVISLSRRGSYFRVTTNGALNRFNTDSVTSATLSGGAGNDKIIVSGSVLLGTSINGGDGSNFLNGGSGSDVIVGGAGNDVIRGNLGDDTIDGGDGNNLLAGGIGNDSLTGGSGNDALNGGLGNDTLTGGLGQDLLIGSLGTNTFYAGDAAADIIDARYGIGNVGQWDDILDVVRGVLSPLA